MVVFTLVNVSHPTSAISFGNVWIELYRPTKVLYCSVEVTFAEVSSTAIMIGAWNISGQLLVYHVVKVLDGLVVITLV